MVEEEERSKEMGGGRSLMARDSVLAGPTGSGFQLTGVPNKYAERVTLSALGPKHQNYFFSWLAASLYVTCSFPVKKLSQNALWVQLST